MSVPLKIQGLVKHYGSLCAVNDVSFEVGPGEIFGLLGPNGAGKTSIISTIVTLEEPTEGQIWVFGEEVARNPRYTKMRTGFVPQEIIHHGFFTVEEVLAFHSGYYGLLRNQERIDWVLSRLGLHEHRKKRVKQLSGGMKRRLMIAKALVHKPRLLLLDEPTAGVDVELRATLWSFVRELRDEGIAILLTTHYLEEAEQLCDRVGIIHKGRLLRTGETARLVQDSTQRKVAVHLRTPHAPLSHPYLVEQQDSRLVLMIPGKQAVGQVIAQLGIQLADIHDLEIKEGTLEEAFLKVIEGGAV
ncbi:MAG: ABC transporter ATP-binding protein [Chlamydiia bacterium]|nr:ABC transporter ATP-binding protein [Chlamydiia bacterium]